jgi:hypothetical protein
MKEHGWMGRWVAGDYSLVEEQHIAWRLEFLILYFSTQQASMAQAGLVGT